MYENLDGIFSFPAAADLSANQYQFVTVNTSGEAALAAAGVLPDGLLHNAPTAAAQPARVISKLGVVVQAKVGTGGVTRGQKCCHAATGIVTGSSTHVQIGKALKAGAAGDIVPFLYQGYIGLVP